MAGKIKVEDVLTITLERKILVLKILAPGEKRGPYIEAKEAGYIHHHFEASTNAWRTV